MKYSLQEIQKLHTRRRYKREYARIYSQRYSVKMHNAFAKLKKSCTLSEAQELNLIRYNGPIIYPVNNGPLQSGWAVLVNNSLLFSCEFEEFEYDSFIGLQKVFAEDIAKYFQEQQQQEQQQGVENEDVPF